MSKLPMWQTDWTGRTRMESAGDEASQKQPLKGLKTFPNGWNTEETAKG